ncbi:RHS repeat-associated core domain-containing protein [Thermodesulfobacteriota bacterium]
MRPIRRYRVRPRWNNIWKAFFEANPNAETGLYYYRARYYNPMQGRFINKDPIGIKDGPNRFIYVGNNPVNMVDPSGEWKHHIVPTAVYNKIPNLSSQARQVFKNSLMELGKHRYWKEHVLYSKLVREMLEEFITKVPAGSMSKELAKKFVKKVLRRKAARKLLTKMAIKGGYKAGATASKLFKKGGKFGKVLSGVGIALILYDELFADISQANPYEVNEYDEVIRLDTFPYEMTEHDDHIEVNPDY